MKKKSTKKNAESRARYFIRAQAKKRGWDVSHHAGGGDFLEENEIEKFFPDIGLLGEKPDFLVCLKGQPSLVIEAKNEAKKVDLAIVEACQYAERINAAGKFLIRIAVGVAGDDETGVSAVVRFLGPKGWIPLTSLGAELTAIPSVAEAELALAASDGTTSVSVPDQSQFIDAAIELSVILRNAKVEAPLRPKVIGAMVAAMYQGEIDTTEAKALTSVNDNLRATLMDALDISEAKKGALVDALTLSGADFNRLSPFIARIVAILKQLNIRAVLHTNTDFLGMFYEAFLRYGYDNNALGIVFTPRHITRFCVELVGVNPAHAVIDIASGTGGFLVSAFDRMLAKAESVEQQRVVKETIYGFDTNPTIWALATLNMFFRGDGKSHIENASCFDQANRQAVTRKFDRAFLNPPFSQENEPEFHFIDAAMDALKPGGLMAAVVYAGIFADEDHKAWRKEFIRRHTLLGMISLPDDLFYPTAAPTTIIVAKAHVPHGDGPAFMARVWNDGYEKLKGRRVPRAGEQLGLIKQRFEAFLAGYEVHSELATTIHGLTLADGAEWSPQQWLPQPTGTVADLESAQQQVIRSVFQAVAHFPSLATQALAKFGSDWEELPELPLDLEKPLSYFFEIANGKSTGEKNYPEGENPYVSSGDALNSIVGLVSAADEEMFEHGGITVTAFGQASLQPWGFLARGNGGSSVRVLQPKFKMSVRDLVWFAAQVNLQRWRFFYARMAIKGRLAQDLMVVRSPRDRLTDVGPSIATRLHSFERELNQAAALA